MIYQLAQAGHDVEVITVFTGDPPIGPLTPFAQTLHERWQAIPDDRRREDVVSLKLLGAQAIHWPYPDAIYRRDSVGEAALYDSEPSIFDEVAAADAATIESIARRLASIDSRARCYVPLTAGYHVDHQIVRRAAESLGRELIYYEDYPYAEVPGKVEAALDDGSWRMELVRLGDEAVRAKARAILAYRSQLSTFFESESEMEQRVRAYATRVGGEVGPAERLWWRG
jgi:LmbE family N-acetylglucosaminyl deacetylase